MVVLRIDDTQCNVREESVRLPRYSAKCFEGVQGWRDNVEMTVEVEATADVMELMGHPEDVHRATEFNASKHSGVVEVDGVPMFEGEATVRGVERVKNVIYYRVHIRALGHEWAHKMAQTRLRNSNVDALVTMTLDGIESTWSGEQMVRMLPLRYDSYPEPEDTGLYTAQQLLMPNDYYPFISVSELLARSIQDGGYRLESRFLGSPLSQRLMMSGAYRRVDTSLLVSKMGFRAMRTTSTTATAGEDGRVYAWLPVMASNIGAIVDTVNPAAVDDQGNAMEGAYSNGGCFTFDEGRPVFTPTREVNVAFDMHLRYTTDYRIASSRYLQGFTQLHLANGCNIEVKLHNPFVDVRNSVSANIMYRLFIFDYDPACNYMLEGYGVVNTRVSSVVFTRTNINATKLMVKRPGVAEFEEFNGDWALYGGYVYETGQRDVVVNVRTPFERITPTSPKRFQSLYFGGAAEGQQMTLHSGCSIEPIFGGAMGYGETATFEDVANVDISQAELLEAVAQMFNLRFYSHAPSKTLFVEPYDSFYGVNEVDWRGRQVGEKQSVTECVAESYGQTVLCYQPADGAAARYAQEEGELGAWDYHVDNYAAKRSVERVVNPLFRPTASFTGATSSAPSAMVLTVGDRDMLSDEGYVSPRIVLYYGVKPLPDGEYWPSPDGDEGYPMAAFHSMESGDTLCFDDRDGCMGLHNFYDTFLEERAKRQRLECDIRLTPMEYAALFDPYGSGAMLRSHFRLDVCGQEALFRLEAIEEYDFRTHTAHCVFMRRLAD